MIERASFRNFKSLRNVDVEFERLTVIVGPNGSGKSSILEGLYLLALAGTGDPEKILSGRWQPDLLLSRGVTDQRIEIYCNDAKLSLLLTVTSDSGREQPRLFWKRVEQPDAAWSKVNQSNVFNTLTIDSIAGCLRGAELLRLDGSKLSDPSYSTQPRPRISSDGEGLSSVLAFLALNQPDQFHLLERHLRSIISSVERIRFDRVPVTRIETEIVTIDGESLTRRLKKEYMGDEVLIDFRGASHVPGHLASEGTILVLGLLAALLGPSRPRLLLVDDLDHGLHPKAQRKLIAMIRTILEENPDLQIIATTHSPYIVDELDPKEVRVTWAGEDGITTCARLDDHPDVERWKDEMWPGEFWSLVGEEWVANGQGREGH